MRPARPRRSCCPSAPRPATIAAARSGWRTATAGPPSPGSTSTIRTRPTQPPEPFASEFAGDPYHGEVAATDAAAGRAAGPLLAAGSAERTLVVLTGDHGEPLGEHGELTHGLFAYEATLRVPLILYAPRLLAPAVVKEPVRHVDPCSPCSTRSALAVPADLPGAQPAGGRRRGGVAPRPATSRRSRRCWAAAGPRSTAWCAATTSSSDLPVPEPRTTWPGIRPSARA